MLSNLRKLKTIQKRINESTVGPHYVEPSLQRNLISNAIKIKYTNKDLKLRETLHNRCWAVNRGLAVLEELQRKARKEVLIVAKVKEAT